jgi:hypothetical protein
VVTYISKQPGVKIDDDGCYESLPHPLDKGCIKLDFMTDFINNFAPTNGNYFNLQNKLPNMTDLLEFIKSIVNKTGLLGEIPYDMTAEEIQHEQMTQPIKERQQTHNKGYMFYPLFNRQDELSYKYNREIIIELKDDQYVYNIYELYYKIISNMNVCVFNHKILAYKDFMITLFLTHTPYKITQIPNALQIRFLAQSKSDYEFAIDSFIKFSCKNLCKYIKLKCIKCNHYINHNNDNTKKDSSKNTEAYCQCDAKDRK